MGFIENVLKQGGEKGFSELLGSGSFCSRTYLPASDIDLVLLTGDNVVNEMEHILSVFQSLCKEVSMRDSGNSVLSSVQSPMTIRNVEFINARTKLCHCLVNNVGVDVTINSVGALTTVLFIEEADRYLAKDHIFKRSLLLVKCWALNDSTACVGQSLLGSKTGMLSSYALCVLVFRLFDQYPDLSHPLAVLLTFFNTYADADWENTVMTVQGPRQVTHSQRASGSIMMEGNGIAAPGRAAGPHGPNLLGLFLGYFSKEIDSLYRQVEESTGVHARKVNTNNTNRRGLPLRSCNIQDPVDANNNLGYSVTRDNLELLQKALVMGRNHFQHLLQLHYRDSSLTCAELALRINEDAISPAVRLAASSRGAAPVDLPFVKSAFPVSFREYFLSLGTRVDLLDHPMQTWRQAHGPGGVDPQLAAPLSEQERGYVEGLHAAVVSRTSKKASGSGDGGHGGEDPLQGELQTMWSALRMELTRQGTAPAVAGVAEVPAARQDRETPQVAPLPSHSPASPAGPPGSQTKGMEGVSASLPVSGATVTDEAMGMAAEQPALTPPLGGSQDQAQSEGRPSGLSSPSNVSHDSSCFESDNDNDTVSASVSVCSSPTPSSPSATSGHSSPLEGGGKSVVHVSGAEGEAQPSPMPPVEPVPEPEPEWSVEPVEDAAAATPGRGTLSSQGGKKAKKKKRRGSSTALARQVPQGLPPLSPSGDQQTQRQADSGGSNSRERETPKLSLSELGLVLKGLHRSNSLHTLVTVLAAITGATLLYYSGQRASVSDQQPLTAMEPVKGILSPSLSAAEVLTPLDVSLSAVSGIKSVAFGEEETGRTHRHGGEEGLSDSDFHGNNLSSSGESATGAAGTAPVAGASYWVNRGASFNLGPPRPDCPLFGLGAAIRDMVKASPNDLDIEVTSGLGAEECPVVVPPPRYRWRKDGKDLNPGEAQSAFLSVGETDTTTAGEYSCVALLGVWPRAALSSLGGELNIPVSGRKDSQASPPRPLEMELFRGSVRLSTPPEISKSMKSKFFDLAEKQPLYLDVQAEGSPPPSYQWYLNGVALPGEDHKTLNIGQIRKEHAGAYTCEVSNMAGSVTFMDITVSVRSAPVSEPSKSPPPPKDGRSKVPTNAPPKRKQRKTAAARKPTSPPTI